MLRGVLLLEGENYWSRSQQETLIQLIYTTDEDLRIETSCSIELMFPAAICSSNSPPSSNNMVDPILAELRTILQIFNLVVR